MQYKKDNVSGMQEKQNMTNTIRDLFEYLQRKNLTKGYKTL